MAKIDLTASGDCTILNAIWKLIWNPQSKFYLPNVIRNGLKDPGLGIDIPPSDSFKIGDLPDVTMFDEPVLGYMKIKLTSNIASGISTIGASNFTCDDSSPNQTKFSFNFSFSALMLNGLYKVSAGGGVGGCAIAAAAKILGGNASALPGASFITLPPDDGTGLALWYQQPLGASDNGQKLVGAYYDNQDAVIDLQNEAGGANSFNRSMTASNVQGTTGAVYTATDYNRRQSQNLLSASEAADPAPTIGADAQYDSGQLPYAYLIAMARRKVKDGHDPDGRFEKLAHDSTHFIDAITWYKTRYPGEQPVGGPNGIMERIATADPIEVLSFVRQCPPHAVIDPDTQQVVEQFKADPPDLNRWQAAYNRKFAASTASPQDVDGNYTDSNIQVTGTLAGTLELVGGTLHVTLTGLSATVNAVTITLHQTAGWWPGLFSKVTNWLANDTFIHGLIKDGLSEGLSSDKFRSLLEDLLNGALKSLG